jgi:hypothetical protein
MEPLKKGRKEWERLRGKREEEASGDWEGKPSFHSVSGTRLG